MYFTAIKVNFTRSHSMNQVTAWYFNANIFEYLKYAPLNGDKKKPFATGEVIGFMNMVKGV